MLTCAGAGQRPWVRTLRPQLSQDLTDDVRRQHEIVFAQGNLAELAVDGGAGVVQRGRLADDGQGPEHTGEREEPEEEAIQDHRYELPILDNLGGEAIKNRFLISFAVSFLRLNEIGFIHVFFGANKIWPCGWLSINLNRNKNIKL